MIPTISQYCGPNTTRVEVNGLTLYFSYQQLVAFRKGTMLCVRENEWGNTTGKHINAIPDSKRVQKLSEEEFTSIWNEVSEQVLFPVHSTRSNS